MLVSVELFRSKVSTLLWSIQLETAGPESARDMSTPTLLPLPLPTATAGGLTVGARYILCVDLDGDGPLPLGPTGLEAWWILVVSSGF